MTDSKHEREAIRSALTDAHRETRQRAPRFALLWARAADQQRSRQATRRTHLVRAAAGGVLVLAVTFGLWTANRRDGGRLERATAMAAALSDWQAPLDFLLDTPGREWLETTPLSQTSPWDVAVPSDVTAPAEPWSITHDLEEAPQ